MHSTRDLESLEIEPGLVPRDLSGAEGMQQGPQPPWGLFVVQRPVFQGGNGGLSAPRWLGATSPLPGAPLL